MFGDFHAATFYAIVPVLSFFALLIVKSLRDKVRRIPGPWGLPIVGYLPFIGGSPFLAFNELSKIYGDVFQISLYSRRYVVLNSYEAINEALSQGYTFSDRPTEFNYFGYGLNWMGVGMQNGTTWKLHRKFILSKMFSLSLVNQVAPKIVEIGHELVDYMSKTNGSPHDFCNAYANCSANAISFVLMNKTFEWDDPHFIQLRSLCTQFFVSVPGMKIMLHGPWFEFFEANRFNSSHRNFVSVIKSAHQLMLKIIAERQLETVDDSSSDYLSAFLREHEREKKLNLLAGEQQFTVEILAHQLYDLLIGGTDTTSEAMAQGIYLLAKNPDVQRRMQQELDKKLDNREPSMSDRAGLPYTMAVIEEILRFGCIIPLAQTKLTREKTQIRGYCVPKDCYVYTNYYAAMRDAKLFKNPFEFDPDNFLGNRGQFIGNKASLPFAAGRRSCIAETFARLELFILLSMVVRKFTFASEPGTSLRANVLDSLVRSIEHYEICAIPRQL